MRIKASTNAKRLSLLLMAVLGLSTCSDGAPVLAPDVQPLFSLGFFPECQVCQGGVTELTLRYNGPSGEVVVKAGKTEIFRGDVVSGETFTLHGHKADGTFGKEIKIRVDGGPEVKIHTSCSRTIGPDLVVGDFEVVEASSRDGGQICPLGPPPECAVCAGGVTELTLRYNGPSGEVVVKAGKTEIFRERLNPGDEFTLHGHKSDGTLGKEIKIRVDGGPEVKIHTSCSKPIGPDMVVGDFEVIEAFSRDGFSVDGKICPVGDLEGCEAGKPQVLVMEYTGEVCSFSNNDQDPSKSVCTDLAPLPSLGGVHIIVTNKLTLGDTKERVWFEGGVPLGGRFNVDATNAGKTKLDANNWAHIFSADTQVLLQEVQFHGSCSQPLAVGDQFGSLIVREFVPEPF